MPIVGGLDIHRKQITFDYLDTVTGQVRRGQIAPADRAHLRAWLARFAGRGDAAFAVEGCAGWRYMAEELAAAHLPGPGVEVVEGDLLPVDIQPAYDGHRDLLKLRRAHARPPCELPTRSILTRV